MVVGPMLRGRGFRSSVLKLRDTDDVEVDSKP